MKNKSEATKSGKPLVTRLSIYDEPHFSIKQFEKRGSFIMVPVAGLEPARIAPPHFECGASANSATPAFIF